MNLQVILFLMALLNFAIMIMLIYHRKTAAPLAIVEIIIVYLSTQV